MTTIYQTETELRNLLAEWNEDWADNQAMALAFHREVQRAKLHAEPASQYVTIEWVGGDEGSDAWIDSERAKEASDG